MGPLQEAGAFDRICAFLIFDHRPIGQIADNGFVPFKALPMKLAIKVINLATANKVLGVYSSTKEARTMTRCQSRNFIQEEKRRVAFPHRFVLHVLVVHVAANPVAGGPATLAQGLVITMELATAIAHHEPAFWHGNDATVGLNAVLQGHGREPEW